MVGGTTGACVVVCMVGWIVVPNATGVEEEGCVEGANVLAIGTLELLVGGDVDNGLGAIVVDVGMDTGDVDDGAEVAITVAGAGDFPTVVGMIVPDSTQSQKKERSERSAAS